MIIATITVVDVAGHWCWAAKPKPKAKVPLPRADKPEIEAVRLAIEDLIETFGDRYPRGREYLNRLEALQKATGSGGRAAEAKLARLREEALLDNPLLDFDKLILLKRKRWKAKMKLPKQWKPRWMRNLPRRKRWKATMKLPKQWKPRWMRNLPRWMRWKTKLYLLKRQMPRSTRSPLKLNQPSSRNLTTTGNGMWSIAIRAMKTRSAIIWNSGSKP